MIQHLIHIGYPKAGSSFLQHWFEAHPQLLYQRSGIAGFHDVYQIARSGALPPGTGYRVTSFEGLSMPMAGADNFFVDFGRQDQPDPVTMQTRVCELLRDLFPGAVILVVTRGFRSMILSTYSQFLRSGGDLDLGTLVGAALGQGVGVPAGLVTVEHWHYDRLIGQYREAFGADGVVVMPYELLRDDPIAFTRALEARLHIDPGPAARERVNVSLSGEEMAWYPRLARGVHSLRSRKAYRLYARAALTNRLRLPIRFLQRLRPVAPVTADMIPDEALEQFRGLADSLRLEPLFEPYAADYLW